MTESKYIYSIKINGEEHEAKVYMKTVDKYIDKINKELQKQIKQNVIRTRRKKEIKPIIVPINIIYGFIWEVLVKDGFLFFKKPFRNKKQMIDLIMHDEFQGIADFFNIYIFNNNIPDENSEQDETKKN